MSENNNTQDEDPFDVGNSDTGDNNPDDGEQKPDVRLDLTPAVGAMPTVDKTTKSVCQLRDLEMYSGIPGARSVCYVEEVPGIRALTKNVWNGNNPSSFAFENNETHYVILMSRVNSVLNKSGNVERHWVDKQGKSHPFVLPITRLCGKNDGGVPMFDSSGTEFFGINPRDAFNLICPADNNGALFLVHPDKTKWSAEVSRQTIPNIFKNDQDWVREHMYTVERSVETYSIIMALYSFGLGGLPGQIQKDLPLPTEGELNPAYEDLQRFLKDFTDVDNTPSPENYPKLVEFTNLLNPRRDPFVRMAAPKGIEIVVTPNEEQLGMQCINAFGMACPVPRDFHESTRQIAEIDYNPEKLIYKNQFSVNPNSELLNNLTRFIYSNTVQKVMVMNVSVQVYRQNLTKKSVGQIKAASKKKRTSHHGCLKGYLKEGAARPVKFQVPLVATGEEDDIKVKYGKAAINGLVLSILIQGLTDYHSFMDLDEAYVEHEDDGRLPQSEPMQVVPMHGHYGFEYVPSFLCGSLRSSFRFNSKGVRQTCIHGPVAYSSVDPTELVPYLLDVRFSQLPFTTLDPLKDLQVTRAALDSLWMQEGEAEEADMDNPFGNTKKVDVPLDITSFIRSFREGDIIAGCLKHDSFGCDYANIVDFWNTWTRVDDPPPMSRSICLSYQTSGAHLNAIHSSTSRFGQVWVVWSTNKTDSAAKCKKVFLEKYLSSTGQKAGWVLDDNRGVREMAQKLGFRTYEVTGANTHERKFVSNVGQGWNPDPPTKAKGKDWHKRSEEDPNWRKPKTGGATKEETEKKPKKQPKKKKVKQHVQISSDEDEPEEDYANEDYAPTTIGVKKFITDFKDKNRSCPSELKPLFSGLFQKMNKKTANWCITGGYHKVPLFVGNALSRKNPLFLKALTDTESVLPSPYSHFLELSSKNQRNLKKILAKCKEGEAISQTVKQKVQKLDKNLSSRVANALNNLFRAKEWAGAALLFLTMTRAQAYQLTVDPSNVTTTGRGSVTYVTDKYTWGQGHYACSVEEALHAGSVHYLNLPHGPTTAECLKACAPFNGKYTRDPSISCLVDDGSLPYIEPTNGTFIQTSYCTIAVYGQCRVDNVTKTTQYFFNDDPPVVTLDRKLFEQPRWNEMMETLTYEFDFVPEGSMALWFTRCEEDYKILPIKKTGTIRVEDYACDVGSKNTNMAVSFTQTVDGKDKEIQSYTYTEDGLSLIPSIDWANPISTLHHWRAIPTWEEIEQGSGFFAALAAVIFFLFISIRSCIRCDGDCKKAMAGYEALAVHKETRDLVKKLGSEDITMDRRWLKMQHELKTEVEEPLGDGLPPTKGWVSRNLERVESRLQSVPEKTAEDIKSILSGDFNNAFLPTFTGGIWKMVHFMTSGLDSKNVALIQLMLLCMKMGCATAQNTSKGVPPDDDYLKYIMYILAAFLVCIFLSACRDLCNCVKKEQTRIRTATLTSYLVAMIPLFSIVGAYKCPEIHNMSNGFTEPGTMFEDCKHFDEDDNCRQCLGYPSLPFYEGVTAADMLPYFTGSICGDYCNSTQIIGLEQARRDILSLKEQNLEFAELDRVLIGQIYNHSVESQEISEIIEVIQESTLQSNHILENRVNSFENQINNIMMDSEVHQGYIDDLLENQEDLFSNVTDHQAQIELLSLYDRKLTSKLLNISDDYSGLEEQIAAVDDAVFMTLQNVQGMVQPLTEQLHPLTQWYQDTSECRETCDLIRSANEQAYLALSANPWTRRLATVGEKMDISGLGCSTTKVVKGIPTSRDNEIIHNYDLQLAGVKGTTHCLSTYNEHYTDGVLVSNYSQLMIIKEKGVRVNYPYGIAYQSGVWQLSKDSIYYCDASSECQSGTPLPALSEKLPQLDGKLNLTSMNLHGKWMVSSSSTAYLSEGADSTWCPLEATSPNGCLYAGYNVEPKGGYTNQSQSTYQMSGLLDPSIETSLEVYLVNADTLIIEDFYDLDVETGTSQEIENGKLTVDSEFTATTVPEGYGVAYGERSIFGPIAIDGANNGLPGSGFNFYDRDDLWRNANWDETQVDMVPLGQAVRWITKLDPLAEALVDTGGAWVRQNEEALGGSLNFLPTELSVTRNKATPHSLTIEAYGTIGDVEVFPDSPDFQSDRQPTITGDCLNPQLNLYARALPNGGGADLAFTNVVYDNFAEEGGLETILPIVKIPLNKSYNTEPIKFDMQLKYCSGSADMVLSDSSGIGSEASEYTDTVSIRWSLLKPEITTLNDVKDVEIDGTEQAGPSAESVPVEAPPDSTSSGLPWWGWALIIVAVLIVVGIVVFCICRKKGENNVIVVRENIKLIQK